MAMSRRRRSLWKVAVSDISRFGKISAVVFRHGFGQLAVQLGFTRNATEGMSSEELAADPTGTARRFRALLEELGATFIKLGQILSTRPDLLPEPFIQELSKLQDHVPPLSFEVVKEAIEKTLDKPLKGVFAEFDEAPLATGSIAQTHMARLAWGGDRVVVKVLRPGLEALIAADIDLLRMLASLLEATIEEMGLYTPSRIVEEFEDGLSRELDFHVEAASLKHFGELFANQPGVWIPKVYDAYSTDSMLVMEHIPGVKITELEPESERAQKIVLNLLDYSFSMLFEHGVFHGDPHPGNLLVTEDDRVGYIDFGLVGHLSRQQQDILIGLIISVVSGDADGIARAVLKMGRTEGRVPLNEMRQDIIDIRARYLQSSVGTIDLSAFTAELLEAGQRYQIRVNADYALLTKATVSVEGIIRTLYPSLDIPSALRPYARKLLVQRYGPQRLAQGLLSGALSVSGMMGDFPQQLTQLMMDLEHEGLRVQVENRGLSELKTSLKSLGARIVMGMLAAALTVCLYLELTRSPATSVSHSWMVTVLAFLLGGLLSMLILWHLFEGRVRKVRITPLVRWFWGRRD